MVLSSLDTNAHLCPPPDIFMADMPETQHGDNRPQMHRPPAPDKAYKYSGIGAIDT